eukprot:SM000025S08475  [mRNA]  locus=s25:940202:941617:- [translate_table: standard]
MAASKLCHSLLTAPSSGGSGSSASAAPVAAAASGRWSLGRRPPPRPGRWRALRSPLPCGGQPRRTSVTRADRFDLVGPSKVLRREDSAQSFARASMETIHTIPGVVEVVKHLAPLVGTNQLSPGVLEVQLCVTEVLPVAAGMLQALEGRKMCFTSSIAPRVLLAINECLADTML